MYKLNKSSKKSLLHIAKNQQEKETHLESMAMLASFRSDIKASSTSVGKGLLLFSRREWFINEAGSPPLVI